MTSETVAAILTKDQEIQDRIAGELRACSDPESVLALVEGYRIAASGPIEGDALVRAVHAAVNHTVTQAEKTTRVPRRKRMSGFVIEPEAILRDAAVQCMNTQEWAAFSRLMLELWRQPEPGVVPDSDAALARLAGMSREEWASVRPAVQRAFDTRKRPGFWTLPSMVEAIAKQDMYVDAKVAAGKRGAQVKAQKRLKRGARLRDKQTSSAAQPIANPGIRVSGDPGIRSQETNAGNQEGMRNRAPLELDDGSGREIAPLPPQGVCPFCGGRTLRWESGEICTGCHHRVPANGGGASGASNGRRADTESSRGR